MSEGGGGKSGLVFRCVCVCVEDDDGDGDGRRVVCVCVCVCSDHIYTYLLSCVLVREIRT